MKRKILSFVLALCLIIPCALVFTACGNKDEDPAPDTAIYVATETELRTALTASTGEKEIKLSQNIDLVTGIQVSTVAIINLNGKTLTATTDTAGDGLFCVVEGGKLTIEGEGTINSVPSQNKWSMVIWAKGGEVVINGGTYTNVGATGDDPEHFDLIYASLTGKVTINGGTFMAQTPVWTLNLKDDARTTASITVKGGTFKSFNPANITVEGNITTYVATDYTVASTTDANDASVTWYTVVANAE